ncbi:histidine kinase dimerization/phospho-acceptor domain-containing protein [Piscinibacter sakaiensis]|uniref:sensor histidine kinase n=1 Tax=Piscinibacter sakaiensis TaxID=1547922 RepID=UPI0037264DCB
MLQAHGLWQAQQPAAALALVDGDAVEPPRDALERQVAHATRASILADLGRWDASMRERYAALHAARATQEPAAVALRLTTEAEQACTAAGATHAGIVASMNRLNALVALGLHDEAVAVTQRMLALCERITPVQQEQAHIQFAWALVRAGQPAQAQALLDRSVELRRLGHLLEWTLTQAEIWNAQGRHAPARALCEDWLARQPAGINRESPAERLRLHQAAALACEALGDLAATVRYQREGQRLYEQMVGRSARAKRLTLEIEFELERERHARDEAERQRQAAVAERERLDALNRALEAASLAKSRFLAAASHDLRQPVHALALQVAALRAHLADDVQQDMAARIERCVGALGGMFNALLDLSRIDAGGATRRCWSACCATCWSTR